MIREAKDSEIEKIITITKACAAKMIGEGIFQWNDTYPNREAFQTDLARGELFVLIDNNKVCGCITISSVKDTEYNDILWKTEDKDAIYIHRLAIHPSAQHQGNAKRLMDFAENYAREHNAPAVRLDTFSKNERNQRFYEARGYRKLGDVYFPRQTEFPFHCYELVLA